MTIAIVDYGVGNLRSVERALVHAGAEPLITADPDQLERAQGLVLACVSLPLSDCVITHDDLAELATPAAATVAAAPNSPHSTVSVTR